MSSRQPIKREPISIAIKRSIRLYHEKNEGLTIGEMVSWAEEKYGLPFLPATMRTIIFPKHTKSAAPPSQSIIPIDRQRERSSKWPELELELAKWYRSLMTIPTGQEVRAKAIDIWEELAPDQYIGQKQPSFGSSWRDKFKARYGFKAKGEPVENTVMGNEVTSTNNQKFLDAGLLVDAGILDGTDDWALATSHIRTPISAIANLDHSEESISAEFLNTLGSMPLGGAQDQASQQLVIRSPKAPFPPSGQLTGSGQHEGTHETLSTPHSTTSSALGSTFLGAPPQKPCTSDNQSTVRREINNRDASQVAQRHHYLNKYGTSSSRSQMTGPKVSHASCSSSRNMLSSTEPHDRSQMRESIFNLYRMVSSGGQTIPSRFVECIVDSLVSAIETANLSSLRAANQGILCSYYPVLLRRLESSRVAALRAVRILQLADTFILQNPVRTDESQLEWDLLFDPVIRLPSQDPQCETRVDSEGSGGIKDIRVDGSSHALAHRVNVTSANNPKPREATILSKIIDQGRIDILTSTKLTVGQPEINDYSAEIILTLPSKEMGSVQIRFMLWQQATMESKTLRTPIISVSQLRPNDSKVFEVAAAGTKEALIQMFIAREASITDRDMSGRSLINYAIASCNLDVCRYLLQYVHDVNAYEINFYGRRGPLLSMIKYSQVDMSEENRRSQIQCYKMLLEKGADPTLYTQRINVFESQLLSGIKDTVEASINLGFPTLNINSVGDEDQQHSSPLSLLATYYAIGHPNLFQAANKFEFLLKRGANVTFTNCKGNTSLHLILTLDKSAKLHLVGPGLYDEDEFMSILMAMITAGADVRAVNKSGFSVSDFACRFDNEDVWIKALAACGYNPWDVFTLGGKCHHSHYRQQENEFFAGTIVKRPAMLSLEEHYNQQTSISPAAECLRIKQSIERVIFNSHKVHLLGNKSCRCNCSQWDDGRYSDQYSDSDSSDDEEWERASDFQEDHYIPMDDDPNWMLYIPRHQFSGVEPLLAL